MQWYSWFRIQRFQTKRWALYCKAIILEILPFWIIRVNLNNFNLEHSSIDPNLKDLLCQLNNLPEKENNDIENLPDFKYKDVNYLSNLDVNLNCLSFFHINIKSLSKNFNNFSHMTNDLKLYLKIWQTIFWVFLN